MATALAGGVPNVAAFCRVQGISRKTFYKWRARFAALGVDGLQERSRRPASSPGLTGGEVEDLVVRLRKELAQAGADHGPDPIRWTLLGDATRPALLLAAAVPSRATIARILTRRGLVVPAPRKRPKSSLHRFLYARANECWQSDWTSWRLADGSPVAIAGTVDDHSRLLVGIGACAGDGTAALVWQVMAAAIGGHGVPVRSLSDNGTCYSLARRGLSSSAFEANLRALGCQPITSSPYHPQTCGKIERFWQTLKKWLLAEHQRFGWPATLADLDAALTRFAAFYNTRRPHRALHGATPAAAFAAATRARPPDRPLPAPLTVHHSVVTSTGVISVANYMINLGTRWRGTPTTTIKDGDHIAIFTGNQLLRALVADPTRRYQPTETKDQLAH